MVIKNATQVGNPLIRSRAKQIKNPKSKAVERIVKNLTDSMRHHNLVGMAAPQIGKDARIFLSEVRKTKLRKGKTADALRVFINPRITQLARRKTKGWEGCGSVAFANLFGLVERPASLVVEASDQRGKKFKLKAAGLVARIIQHEIDHLNGVVFTDKVDLRTLMSRDEYLKMRAKKK